MDGGNEKAQGGNGWMDVWADGWTGVCKQFGMATLDEPLAETSESEGKGNMDGPRPLCWQQPLTQQCSQNT